MAPTKTPPRKSFPSRSRPPTPLSSSTSSSATLAHAPTTPASKASAAVPLLDTSSNEMELGNLPPSGSHTPAAANSDGSDYMMILARVGDVVGMERLLDTGSVDVKHTDAEGITALHWASINNKFAMCQFLLARGADVNAIGGDSRSSPIQWACQKNHYYVVWLLLQHGADPLVKDNAGYNTIHTATFQGATFPIVLLLHHGVFVDVADDHGHTALQWAAYKGYPHIVDLLLRWGANVSAVDLQGMTALHWGVRRGSPGCVQKLIEYGADRFAATSEGQTPAWHAEDANNLQIWHHSLAKCGYDRDGKPTLPDWPMMSWLLKDREKNVSRVLYLSPFLLVWLIACALAYLPVYLSLLTAVALAFAFMSAVMKIMQYLPPASRGIHKTPFLAGIFSGSMAFVGLNWLFVAFPRTTWQSDEPTLLLNLVFVGLFGLVLYYYAVTMVFDPGFVPKMNGIAEQKAVLDELATLYKLDEDNFCLQCMIRTPLRSKHCKICRRCVAKYDHHCPWTNNCVGVNNHRHFFFYIIFLFAGIMAYDGVLYYYFDSVSAEASESCAHLAPPLCKMINSDAYTFVLAIWISFQLLWIWMLLITQFVQVARGITTHENMFGIQPGARVDLTSTGASPDMDQSSPSTGPDSHGHGHGHGHDRRHAHGSRFRKVLRLLGVEPFLETVRGTGAATGPKQWRRKNPYSRGCVSNCRDFWCDQTPIFGTREAGVTQIGGERVNYMMMYESPALMELERGRRMGRGRAGGYEAVAGSEET